MRKILLVIILLCSQYSIGQTRFERPNERWLGISHYSLRQCEIPAMPRWELAGSTFSNFKRINRKGRIKRPGNRLKHGYTYTEQRVYIKRNANDSELMLTLHHCVIISNWVNTGTARVTVNMEGIKKKIRNTTSEAIPTAPATDSDKLKTSNDVMYHGNGLAQPIGDIYPTFQPIGQRHWLKKSFRLNKRIARCGIYGFGYVSLNFMPASAFRYININDRQFLDVDNFNARWTGSETPVFGQTWSLQAGWSFAKAHTIFAEYSTTTQGFNATKAVDFNTGLQTTDGDYSYRLYRSGLGLGYKYSGYRRQVNGVFETALDYYFMKEPTKGSIYNDGVNTPVNNYSQLKKMGIEPNFLAWRIGAGVNLRFGYLAEVKIVPTFMYGLSAISKRGVATHVYSTGLNIGLGIYL